MTFYDDERPESLKPARLHMELGHFHAVDKVEGAAVQPLIQANEIVWQKLKLFVHMLLADGQESLVPIWGPEKFYARREGASYHTGCQYWQYDLLWSAGLNRYAGGDTNAPPDWHDVFSGQHRQGIAICTKLKVSADGNEILDTSGQPCHTLYVGTYGKKYHTQEAVCYSGGSELRIWEGNAADLADLLVKNRQRALSDYKTSLLYASIFPRKE